MVRSTDHRTEGDETKDGSKEIRKVRDFGNDLGGSWLFSSKDSPNKYDVMIDSGKDMFSFTLMW